MELRALWTNRWVRACLVAVAVAAWPACSADRHTAVTSAPKLDLVLKDMSGKDVRLADFKGRPLLVNFWATWCPPCKAEIPWFVEFKDKYEDQNLAIVGISVDDPAADIQKFAAEYKINYPMLVGNGHDDLMAAYEANDVIPVSWLVKADGSVLEKIQGIHPKDWFEAQMKGLF